MDPLLVRLPQRACRGTCRGVDATHQGAGDPGMIGIASTGTVGLASSSSR